MKLEHVEVILLENPLSNGVGKVAVVPVAADTSPLLVCDSASVDDEEEDSVAVAVPVPVPVLLGGVIVAVEVMVAASLFSLRSESRSRFED